VTAFRKALEIDPSCLDGDAEERVLYEASLSRQKTD
jgi:hypothetical protein